MIFSIARRELTAYLTSPFAWIVCSAFLFINGVFFAMVVAGFSQYSREAVAMGQEVSVATDVLQPFVATVGLLMVLFAPLLTMRVLAEEQRSGSIALLLSSPVSSWEIVLGKFAGLMGFWIAVFGIGMLYVPGLLGHFSDVSMRPLVGASLGVLLLAAATSAVGLAASSLSGSQMLAAVASWSVLLFLWIVGFLQEFNGFVGTIGSTLGMNAHYSEFGKGLLRSTDLIYFALFTFFCLFVAQQRVESHRWS